MGKHIHTVIYGTFRGSTRLKTALCRIAFFWKEKKKRDPGKDVCGKYVAVLGCYGDRMLLKHERNYGLGMDALVITVHRNMNGIIVLGMDVLAIALIKT